MTKSTSRSKSDPITSYIVLRDLDKEYPFPVLEANLEDAEKTFRAKNVRKGSRKAETRSIADNQNFESLLDNALDAFLPYYQLASFSRIIGPALARVVLIEATLGRKSTFSKIRETKTKAIYGLTDSQFEEVSESVTNATKIKNAFEVVPNSVLLSIVATYDAHVGNITRFSLLNNPQRIISGDQTYKARDIFKASSFDELLQSIVDDEVHLILWESHQKQIEKIEELFGFSIIQNFPFWGKFIEVFERRNLVAHGVTNANERYISICEKSDCPENERLALGEEIDLDSVYLRKSVDSLLLFLIVLVWNIWIKLKRNEFADAYEKINKISYILISEGRYRLSTRLLTIMIGWKNKDIPERSRRMMVINLANAHKFLEEREESEEVLKTYQWDSVSDDFKICEAAVREDTSEVCRLMPKFKDEEAISKVDFRTWPVFNWVRDDEKFRAKFQEVFNEELIKSRGD